MRPADPPAALKPVVTGVVDVGRGFLHLYDSSERPSGGLGDALCFASSRIDSLAEELLDQRRLLANPIARPVQLVDVSLHRGRDHLGGSRRCAFDRERAGRGIARWAVVLRFVVVAVKGYLARRDLTVGPDGGAQRRDRALNPHGATRERPPAGPVLLDDGPQERGEIWLDVALGTALDDDALRRHDSSLGTRGLRRCADAPRGRSDGISAPEKAGSVQ